MLLHSVGKEQVAFCQPERCCAIKGCRKSSRANYNREKLERQSPLGSIVRIDYGCRVAHASRMR